MQLTKHGEGACIQIADHEAEVARLRDALKEQASAGTLDPQRITDLIRERDALKLRVLELEEQQSDAADEARFYDR